MGIKKRIHSLNIVVQFYRIVIFFFVYNIELLSSWSQAPTFERLFGAELKVIILTPLRIATTICC